MSPDAETRLLPPINEETAPFWEGARRGELRVQSCPDTGRLIFPPRATSPWGDHRAPEWVTVSGRGTIWSVVVPHPPLLPQFAEVAPYNVVLVELEEDPTVRLIGNLVSRPGGSIGELPADQIEIGAAVRAVFDEPEGDIAMLRWVLA